MIVVFTAAYSFNPDLEIRLACDVWCWGYVVPYVMGDGTEKPVGFVLELSAL